MTDKIQKIRQEVEKLKSNLLYGACASQVAMETRCKEEAYNEVLAILDTMQEQHKETNFLDELKTKLDSMSKEEFEQVWEKYRVEEEGGHVSIWHDASEKPNIKEKSGIFVITSLNGEYIGSRYYNHNDITITLGNYDKWAYLNDLLNLSNVQRTTKNWKEPVSEELEEASRNYADNEEYGDDVYFAIKAAFKAGAKWQKEHLMKNAVDGEIGYWNLRWLSVNADLPRTVEEGDKVKVILIKEK